MSLGGGGLRSEGAGRCIQPEPSASGTLYGAAAPESKRALPAPPGTTLLATNGGVFERGGSRQ